LNAVVVQLIRLQQFSSGYLQPMLNADGDQVMKRRKKVDKETGEIEYVEVPQWIMTEPSAKLDAVMELIEQRKGEPLVIWSWSRAFINLLANKLDEKGMLYGKLTGEVPAADRRQYVEDFQAGRLPLFIGTIKAGGVGITLHKSSTAVFVDRAWNPSHNIQAEDRVHRIGQVEAVQIIDIVARNTVDLGKSQKLTLKWQWLQKLLGDEVDYNQVVTELDLSTIIEVDEEEGE